MASTEKKSTKKKDKTWHTLDTKLNTLKDLVKKRKEEDQLKNYKQFKPIYDIIYDIIRKKNLIVYGGVAINALMPAGQKIYDKQSLSDIDVLSLNAERDARDIADELHRRGVQYVKVTPGIKPKVFKITAELRQIVDLKQIDPIYHEFLMSRIKGPRKLLSTPHGKTFKTPLYIQKGLCYVPIEHCFWAFHKELAMPETSLFRWQKVFERYAAFYNNYRFATIEPRYKELDFPKYMADSVPDEVKDVYIRLRDWAKKSRLPIIGNYGVGLHLGMNQDPAKPFECCFLPYSPFIDMLTLDMTKTLAQIKRAFKVPQGYTLSWRMYPHNKGSLDALMPERGRLSLLKDGDPNQIYALCRLYDATTECYSTVRIGDYTVGSVDTILMFLYGYYATNLQFQTDTGLIGRHTLTQIALLESYIEENMNDISHRLSTTCYGHAFSYLDWKKEQFGKKAREYVPL
jgi:hypothetical protein